MSSSQQHVVATAKEKNRPSAGATPTHDSIHQFLGYGVHPSRCRVRVYHTLAPVGLNVVAVLTELADNPGTNITSSIEQICSELLPGLVQDEGLRDRLTWIEHWPADLGAAKKFPRLAQDAFDMVRFSCFDEVGSYYARKAWGKGYGAPRWVRIDRASLESLIGGRFE